MPDLADRISRAAVTALDLAPFDERFAALSRQVLTGGASRFTKVIDERQAISYIIPVGVAGERIDYGALVLQPEAAGLVWRDASGTDQHATVSVTPGTPATYSTVQLGGESWVRFSIGLASRLTFLVPPVRSQALLPTLVHHFQATPGPAPATVLREPPLTTEEATSTSVLPLHALPTAPALAAPDPVEETGPIPRLPERVHVPDPPVEETKQTPLSPQPAALDLGATQPIAAPDVDHEPTRSLPSSPHDATSPFDATQALPLPREEESVAPWGAAAPFALFREPAATPERTQVLPDVPPYPHSLGGQDAWAPAPGPSPAPVVAAVSNPPAPSGSSTLRAFVIGLFATIVVGSIVLAFILLG